MERTQVTLTFDSQEDADLFVAKFMYCGGEQSTGFMIIKDKSVYADDKKLLHLANSADTK